MSVNTIASNIISFAQRDYKQTYSPGTDPLLYEEQIAFANWIRGQPRDEAIGLLRRAWEHRNLNSGLLDAPQLWDVVFEELERTSL